MSTQPPNDPHATAADQEAQIKLLETFLASGSAMDDARQWARTQHDLAIAYWGRIHGDRADNLERAIEAFGAALTVYTREAAPYHWAAIRHNLANAYSDRIRGDRADNIERVIAGYEAVLTVYASGTAPHDWARIQNSLALAYSDRIRGDRADNIERAIEAFEAALAIYMREAAPHELAFIQHNLGMAYWCRKRGDRADNIERAIAAYEDALKVFTHEAVPHGWARIQNNLALAYLDRIRGDRADNIERAIVACEAILTIYRPEAAPHDWAATQTNLANAYAKRIRGDRADSIERAIAAYDAALTVFTRETAPYGWALTQINVANAYSDRIRGDRADSIERAIEAYEAALAVYTREAAPYDWAMIQNNLATTYLHRIREDRAENIERAIAACEAALTVYAHTAAPHDWAMSQNNLALAYSDRIRGDRADNLERAIEACEAALTVYTHTAAPHDWAGTQKSLAHAYQNRIRGDRADNLERAIEACETALTVYTHTAAPHDWAGTQKSLAHAYQNRIRGDRAANIDLAIEALEAAQTIYTRDAAPHDWARTQNNLAIAYRSRVRGDRADNLERAIEAFEAALTVLTREGAPRDWAATKSSLAIAYVSRMRGDRAANVERAIEACEAALTVYTPAGAPRDWASTQNNLANAYRSRIRGDRADNIDRAIASYEAALTVYTPAAAPHDWASIQNNLAAAYRIRIRGGRADNLERAIEGCEAALTVYTRDAAPHDWARTQNNLANAYTGRILGNPATNLATARSCMVDAISVASAGIEFEFLCGNLCAIGRAFLSLTQPFGRAFPHLAHPSRKSIETAQDCFDDARRLFWERREEFLTPSALKEALEAMTAVGPLSVVASHRLGNPAEGLSALEVGRAIGLREVLALDESALAGLDGDDRDRIVMARRRLGELHLEAQMWTEPAALSDGSDMTGIRIYSDIVADIEATRHELAVAREVAGLGSAEPLSVEEILGSLAPGTTALVPVATKFGSIIYAIPAGTTVLDQRHALDLPLLKESELAEKTEAWLAAYDIVRERTRNRDAYDAILAASLDAGNVLDGILQWCWDSVMGPATGRLAELGMTSDNTEELIILPQGRWSLLPLHAAWRVVDGQKRAVLDDFAISYIPSFHALKTARDRNATISGQGDDAVSGRLLALINPEKSDPGYDLPGSEELEVPALRAWFPDAEANPILVGDAASKARLLDECSDRSYLHLSCHGEFDWSNPDQSGLKFAGGEKLRVPEIAGLMKLDRCRWVMLSACESGIVDTKDIAEESYGQVAAFMMAGASAVTATLWAVDDTDTALFVEKAYEEHIKNGLSPAKATQRASLWLRDLSIPERDALTARLAPNKPTRRLSIPSPIKPIQDHTVPDPGASEIALQKSPLSWAPYTTWGV